MAFKVKLPRRPQNRSRATTRTIRKLFIFRKYGRVGKTRHSMRRRDIKRKHPHRRGEDEQNPEECHRRVETPPQAWGRLVKKGANLLICGNTPPGVGKTLWRFMRAQEIQKHPHRRGEDFKCAGCHLAKIETPPQAWGRRHFKFQFTAIFRNTPTGVGKTASLHSGTSQPKKHPHRRGEDSKESLNFLTNALCHHSLSFSRTSCNPLMRTSSRR